MYTYSKSYQIFTPNSTSTNIQQCYIKIAIELDTSIPKSILDKIINLVTPRHNCLIWEYDNEHHHKLVQQFTQSDNCVALTYETSLSNLSEYYKSTIITFIQRYLELYKLKYPKYLSEVNNIKVLKCEVILN